MSFSDDIEKTVLESVTGELRQKTGNKRGSTIELLKQMGATRSAERQPAKPAPRKASKYDGMSL